jgi:hypothetical protein
VILMNAEREENKCQNGAACFFLYFKYRRSRFGKKFLREMRDREREIL